jgi:long-chain acyl-CoA synthetase
MSAATLDGAIAPTTQRPWLSEYPPGVPADVDWDSRTTLVDVLEASFQQYAGRRACECLGQQLTFADVDRLSRDLGAWLQQRKLSRGARVALMMPNIPQYSVAIAAVLRAGYAVVNVNPLYTPRELEHQLNDSGAEAIVILENFACTLEAVIDRTQVRHVVLAAMGDVLGFWKGRLVNFAVRHLKKAVPAFRLPIGEARSVTRFVDACSEGSRSSLHRASITSDDVAFIQYTGGTTGVSKGAMLLHRNVVANILQTEAWFAPMMERVAASQMTVVCALPMYHIFALTICYLMGARLGMMNLLIPNPRDIASFVRALQDHRINMFPAVNTLFNALANDPAFARLDFSRLVVSNGGGMAVQEATAARWLEVTGCPIVEGYGLSETSPVATSNRVDNSDFSGTIGVPIPSTEVRIRDDDGHDVPVGAAGEICIRGPQVMAGYWQRPDETAQVMTHDRFFKTGDIGVMDERGQFRIVDRKKDMILVSGFNVYPTEIEQVVSAHPGVLECAVVGVPDPKSGEAVKLVIVKRDADLSEEDVARYCRDNFTAYKRPRSIEFRDELPKSNVGKILRRELRGH